LVKLEERRAVKGWLDKHAYLYQCQPEPLKASFTRYVTQAAGSTFAAESDIWDVKDPGCFWSLVLNDADDMLGVIGQQLTGFQATTGDLERSHSVLGYLHNKQCNRLTASRLRDLAFINRQLYAVRRIDAQDKVMKAAVRSMAAQRAAEEFCKCVLFVIIAWSKYFFVFSGGVSRSTAPPHPMRATPIRATPAPASPPAPTRLCRPTSPSSHCVPFTL